MEHPAQEFAVGQPVRVVLSDRNRTPHAGSVRRVVWHFKLSRWTFFLDAGGKCVSKRYFADDLTAEPPADVTESPSPHERGLAPG